jgi:diguanylate cyclase (GGDEF)-like protein/PAS domain S-box-containing protein
MPIGYLRVNRQGLILDANRAAVKILGVYRTKLKKQPFVRFVCDEHRAAYLQFHDTVAAAGLGTECELKLKVTGGRKLWVSLVASWAPLAFDATAPGAQPENSKTLIVMISDITERKHNEADLRTQRRLLSNVINHVPSTIGYWDRNLRNHFCNDAYQTWFGIDPKQVPGKHMREVIGEERFRLNLPYSLAALRGEYQEFERHIPAVDGSFVRQAWAQYIPDIVDGEVVGFIALVTDVTQARSRDALLSEQLASLRLNSQALNQISQGVMIAGLDFAITFVNEAFEKITGYAASEVLGRSCRFLRGPLSQTEVIEEIREALDNARPFSGEIINYRKDGATFWNELSIAPVFDANANLIQFVGVQRDISERKAAEERVMRLAFYDSLTNTPNRTLFISRLQALITDASKRGQNAALLFLDIDHFKLVNETLGHAFGDLMLIEASRRVQSCVRSQDTVAHMSGDDFAVLVPGMDANPEIAAQDIAQVAENIRRALALPFDLNGQEILSSASIGVCIFCGPDVSVHDVLKRSDMAMYRAKSGGRNAVQFFDWQMQTELEIHAALESDLRRAVRDQQLDLHFQIQVDSHQRIVGAEALVRWNHPTRGMVPPGKFIPLAEESRLIVPVGRWVLEFACRQLRAWAREERTRQLTLAVNISAVQFSHSDLVADVAGLLQKFGLGAGKLKLELTESVVLNDLDDVVRKMHALKELGVSLSMDDFGTGYSSLWCLKRLPLDQIKIDKSFVRDITCKQSDCVMVQTIIDMARNFHLDVIAEGVETEAQRAMLQHLGCEAYQGYLFGRPVPIAALEELLLKI